MNKLTKFFGIMAALLSFGCGSEDSPKDSAPLTKFEVEPIVFDAEKGTQSATIEFEAGADWNATLGAVWLKASPTTGKAGKATITVQPLLDNTSMQIRSAELTVLVDGESTPYRVKISQVGTTGVITVNKTSLTLKPNNTGTAFQDTLTVTSNREWTLHALPSWISYTILGNQKPQNGKLTTVQLLVVGEYERFDNPETVDGNVTMSGAFMIKAADGTQSEPIDVKAVAGFAAYTSKETTVLMDTLFIEKDGAVGANYLGHMYLCADMQWKLSMPEWLTLPVITTNVDSKGYLLPNPVTVIARLNPDHLSIEEKVGKIQVLNTYSKVLQEIPVKFNGTGAGYMDYDIQIPAYDDKGEDFMFDAIAGEGKITRLAFTMRTSVDYQSIEEAPFHLLMSHATYGILRREQVKWAHLEMGDPAKSINADGIHSKELIIVFDNSYEKEIRSAFLFIVPKNIAYDDLFVDATSTTLKDSFTPTQVMQKSNPNAEYTMTVEGLENGAILEFDAEGTGSKAIVYKTKTDTEKVNVAATKNAMSDKYGWMNILINTAPDGSISNFTLSVDKNATKYDRDTEVSFNVYRGEDATSYTMFKFTIKQSKP